MPILRGDIPDQQSMSTGAAEKTKRTLRVLEAIVLKATPPGTLETSKLKSRNPKSAVC
jgi:hypothetical protein